MPAIDTNLEHCAPAPARKDFAIGAIGAGFIMRDVHLVAYERAGYRVAAIASRTPAAAREAARLRGIPRVYDTAAELMADPAIEVLDVAVPPDKQIGVIRQAVKHHRHIKGILAQKPLGTNYAEACEVVRLCEDAGIVLAVNQNMRYDHSIRALKTALNRGYLGEPVLGTIEMRAIPHWKPWQERDPRTTLQVMSIHHLDTFRYLFGDPKSIYVSARTDPRTKFDHLDGIVLYILEYANGLRCSAWDDVWTGPAREGAAADIYIKWRVEGLDGAAWGTIGWPYYPDAVPSAIHFTTKQAPGTWFSPQWKEVWFPDAFQGTMGQLLDALAKATEPAISGRDNLHTMALVEAGYRSLAEHRPVDLNEILGES